MMPPQDDHMHRLAVQTDILAAFGCHSETEIRQPARCLTATSQQQYRCQCHLPNASSASSSAKRHIVVNNDAKIRWPSCSVACQSCVGGQRATCHAFCSHYWSILRQKYPGIRHMRLALCGTTLVRSQAATFCLLSRR